MDGGCRVTRSTQTAQTKARQEWATPQRIFNRLHAAWNFTIDGMANARNAKLPRYVNSKQDFFKQRFSGERVFVNPPFAITAKVVRRTVEMVNDAKGPEMVALWLPANPFGAWWVDVFETATELITFDRRIAHDPPPGIKASSPGGGVMVARFDWGCGGPPDLQMWRRDE